VQTVKPVTKPSKQRKMLYQAPDHVRYKLFAAPLSPELKTSHGTNSLPVRSGDTVRILRGDHKGFEGKITRLDRAKYRIFIEGLTREKVDGTTVFVPIHPSKVMITRLNLEDKWRKKILERKKIAAKVEKVTERPVKKAVETKVEIVEEKPPIEEKPKRRRARVRKKPSAAKEAKKPVKKAEKEEKPKVRKTRTKAKTKKAKPVKKTKGGA